MAGCCSYLAAGAIPAVPGFTVTPGSWGGMVLCANGSSSSECTRLPAGSTMVAVTKIIRFFFWETLDWL